MKTIFSKLQVISFIVLTILGVITQGCFNFGEAIRVSGKVYSSSTERSEVNWYLLPGGSQQSLLFSHYYVELELRNESKRTIPVPRVGAYFYATNGSLLNIRVVCKGQNIRSGEIAKIYLDTDGYTEFLQLSKDDMRGAIYLSVFVSGRVFETTLPGFPELHKQRIVTLDFSQTQRIPDIKRGKLAKVDDWPKAWQSVLGGPSFASDYLRPPALLRRQDAQTAHYFYYLKPVYFTHTIGAISSRLGDEAIATDIVESGVSPDMKLVNVTVTPVR